MIAPVRTKGGRRGKSGLHRAGCRITSGGGDSKASATEINRQCQRALLDIPEESVKLICSGSVQFTALGLVRVERQCKRLPFVW